MCGLLVLVVALFPFLYLHVRSEVRGDLSTYLLVSVGGRVVAPWWLPAALAVLAVANVGGPAMAAVAVALLERDELVGVLMSYLAGGLWGDAWSTHLVPTTISALRRRTRISPGIGTTPFYLLLGTAFAFWGGSLRWFMVGVGSFVVLWPAMFVLGAVLRRRRK